MAHQWQGVVREYLDFMPFADSDRVVTLGEGGTPLVYAESISREVGAEVFVKVEGMNPTGSFKDRGMTAALTQVVNVTNPSLSTYMIEGLSPATYYFAVRAYTSAGAESTNSNVASKTVQ